MLFIIIKIFSKKMKNNLNKNNEISQKKFKESLKSSNQNILYKSYNEKKNRFKENNNIINKQELSDIKSIVKNSVEKINDLFNLQEMKDNSKLSSRKSNEIKSIKNYFDKDSSKKNNIKTLKKYDGDLTNNSNKKMNKKIMKTNITFKINNYLNVLNKSKNCLNNAVNYRNYVNYGIYSDNSNSKNNINNYLTQKNSNNDINITNNTNINSTNVNNTNLNNTTNKSNIGHNLNLKKNNKKKNIKKNNISNYKSNIKSNILMGIKNKKLKTKNEYLFLSPKINKDKNKYYFFNDDLNSKNEEINNNLTEKSIVVNTRYMQNENNKKNHIIKPMKISHINKEVESTITNENQSKDSKNKTNKSNKSNKSYNSEKRKKYIFLKRTKTKNDISEDQDKKKKKKLIFSQKNTKKKYQLANRINNYYNNNFYNTGEGFYPKKRDKINININSDVDNDDFLNINDINDIKDYINKYNESENNNNDSEQKFLNNKIDNELNYNYSPSNDRNNKNDIFSITKEDKGIQTTSRLDNLNNLLISPTSSGSGIDSESKISHHLSKKCKSDNKLKISKKYNNNKNNKETNPILVNLESQRVSRNSNSYASSIVNNYKKGSKILNLIEKKNLFNSSNKKLAELERKNMRKTLKKIYDTPFPNNVVTNDVFKLFLLLNEYIINNNLLSDYNLNNNKGILNKLSKFLSNYSFIDYPKEYDINIDTYIKSVKTIQRAWRKKKLKQFLGRNEEIHELKKIIVNKCISKVGYKMKKIFGLFHSMIEDFNNIENSDDINRMFYYVKNLIKRDLTVYEKNLIYKEFINNFLHLK